MRAWWQKRSLKLRLACWFAAVCLVILLGLLPFVYTQIKHRLYLEVDKQLKVDWDLVETHLEADSSGGIRWRASSPATPDSPGYLGTSFDVCVGERRLLDYVSIFRKPVSVPAPSVPDGMEKNIVAVEMPECRRPSVCPNSCVATACASQMPGVRSVPMPPS